MAIIFALCAGLSNALATVLQRLGVEGTQADAKALAERVAETAAERRAESPAEVVERRGGLMASVLRQPVWFVGLLFMIASFLLQALALSLGNLSTVQPVMVTELVFLLAVLGLWFRQPLGWREWAGACGTAVGLGIFLAAATPRGGGLRPGVTAWGMVLGASAVAIVFSVSLASKGPRSWRAAWYGAAGGVTFALTAALIKVSADYAQAQGLPRIFVHWQPYAIAAAGLVGLVLTQHALQAGPIAASQSSLLVVNPMASILMGVLLFGDHLRTSRGREAVDALALAVMFVGLVVLSHSPLIAGSAEEEQLSTSRDALAGAGGARDWSRRPAAGTDGAPLAGGAGGGSAGQGAGEGA